MMANFAHDKYSICKSWIADKIDKQSTWDDVYNLCVDPSKAANKLREMIDDEMWPEDLTFEQWRLFVDYYKTEYIPVSIVKPDPVIGIPSNNPSNTYVASNDAASAWALYERFLRNSLSPVSVANIEKSCQWVMNHLKKDTRAFGAVKGLVAGSVQSGKTANMEGLVSMAADNDWNFFIILSGTIDNLRKQTRDRFRNDLQNSEGILWNILDFTAEDKKYAAENLRLNPLSGPATFAQRYVTVCLKQAKRLTALINWLYADANRTRKLRIIVIDDEADQASVNTADITDEDYQERCAINQLIVNLVNGKNADGSIPKAHFQAMNYIAYTATPYANVLNEGPGESLYPKDFICTLPEAYEYFGPSVIFGNDEKEQPGLPIIHNISPADEKQLKAIYKGSVTIPVSLEESLAWFLCGSAVLRIKKYKKPVSMLIHTASVQKSHFTLYAAVRKWLHNKSVVLTACRSIYEKEKASLSKADILAANPKYGLIDSIDEQMPEFDEIESEIKILINDMSNIMLDANNRITYGSGIHLCVDNCSANRYAEEGTALRIVYPSKDKLSEMKKAPAFIIIGGNTLARGLTIERLMTTYLTRTTNQADTLMQMARWFGYRKGYELLQRIWMSDSALKKYYVLAKIDADLKKELERFMEQGLTPSQFGPRIRNAPEIKNFMLTSKKKMQGAIYVDFDFSGDSYEITDYEDTEMLPHNIKSVESFLSSITTKCVRADVAKGFVWRDISFSLIDQCLFASDGYHISQASSLYSNFPIFLNWMRQMNTEGKFTKWNIALIDGDNHDEIWHINGASVGCIERTKKNNIPSHIDIGSLRSGRDILCDVDIPSLSDVQNSLLSSGLRSGKQLISLRAKLNLAETPLLLVYRIKKDGGTPTKTRSIIGAKEDLIGIAIIVPGDGIGGNHARAMQISL